MKANPLAQAGLSLVLALCLLLGPAQGPTGGRQVEAQDEVWTIYTNGNHVYDLAIEGDYLWAATDGGVVRWDVRDGAYIKYTGSDGLADNGVEVELST